MVRRLALLALAALPLAAACGDDGASTPTPDTVAVDSAAPADTATVEDTAALPDTAVAADTAVAPDTAAPADTSIAQDTSLPTVTNNCAEAGLAECFSNLDCPEAERCQNVSDNAFEIPCCVGAPRGATATGGSCVTAEDCASGLCLSRNDGPYLCTGACEDVDDCPANMQECDTLFIAPGNWCLHTP